MKRAVLAVSFLVLMGSLAFAEGAPKAGEFGLQGSLIFTSAPFGSSAGDIGVKYIVSDNIAIRAGVGILNQSSGGGSLTLYSIGGGFEYHFGGKGGVSPYAGAEVSYSGESLSTGGTTPSDFGLAAVVGGEYFFSNNFSWAGEGRLGFDSATAAGTTTTTIGTFGFATFLTWYLN